MRSIAMLLFAAATAANADDGVKKIYDCMQANVPQTLRVEQVELETTSRQGPHSLLKGRLFAMRDSSSPGIEKVYAMFSVNSPSTLSGAAYLLRQTAADAPAEMYVFLPAVGRVRRIVGDAGYSTLFQTNFSYDEFKQTQAAFDDATAQAQPSEQIEGRAAYVLSFVPKAGEHSPYTQSKLWVDQKSCVALKVDFYAGAEVRKELTAPVAELRQIEGRWYPGEVRMKDLVAGTQTIMRVTEVSSGDKLPERYFNPRTYYAAK